MFRKPYSVKSHQLFIDKVNADIGRWKYIIHPVQLLNSDYHSAINGVFMMLIKLLRYE